MTATKTKIGKPRNKSVRLRVYDLLREGAEHSSATAGEALGVPTSVASLALTALERERKLFCTRREPLHADGGGGTRKYYRVRNTEDGDVIESGPHYNWVICQVWRNYEARN